MRVYEVECDVNNFQTLLEENSDADTATYPIEIGTPNGNRVVERSTYWFFDRPMPDDWKPTPVYCPDPLDPEPDFWRTPSITMAAGPQAFPYVQTHFEMSGQVLPLPYKSKELKILNTTMVINCLNHPECLWEKRDRGKYQHLVTSTERRLVFHSDRFEESSLFKIPEWPTMLLCWERDGDPEEEFKAAVEQNNLRGLNFNLLWEG